jgi:tRNA G10  N-methylase Trm11
MKKYYFSLGTNESLSLAELQALFSNNSWQKHDSIAVSDLEDEIIPKNLIANLGGTIKIGEIIKEVSLANRHALSDSVKKIIISLAKENYVSGKYNFGFSFYNKKIPGDFFKLGLAIKKELKNLNIPSRMVTSKESILSSVVVEQNKLISKGIEICLISTKNKILIGQTLAVQPFKELSKRDFGRPNRDDFSGMIPPKLAQIMINLARSNDKKFYDKLFLDPFCGSGTILMEAYLMGFKNIIGSDLSEKAINDSQKNMEWIVDLNNKSIDDFNMTIFQSDVLNIVSRLKENSISYIVCEPYLGPARGWQDFSKIVIDLNKFYTEVLIVFEKILKNDGQIVMIWPHFRTNKETWKVKPEIGKLKMESIGVYGRSEQKVWREIIVLKKK